MGQAGIEPATYGLIRVGGRHLIQHQLATMSQKIKGLGRNCRWVMIDQSYSSLYCWCTAFHDTFVSDIWVVLNM
ncbi:MAG: hypothetical protein WAM28_06465 [Chlamydiales bacterium]